MAITAETLATNKLFVSIGPDALTPFLTWSVERQFSPGQVIAVEGEPCAWVYLLARGSVRLCVCSDDGREHALAYVSQGEWLNMASALDGGPQIATIEAVTHATLHCLPRDRFRTLLATHPHAALFAAEHLAAEVRRFSEMIEELALHTVRTRLARFLLSSGENPPTQTGWTQQAIAAQIGTVRDVAGRALRALAEEGLIRRQQGNVVVVDREGLEREAHGS
ncbi:MAG: Crp/Fnr family transcriptional regulator [Anaerolineae bacterium]